MPIRTKLTLAIVRHCRRVYRPGHPTRGVNPLARKYGVSRRTMHKALVGLTWQRL
jgi:DNA-binding GntR family transcriptional regulator